MIIRTKCVNRAPLPRQTSPAAADAQQPAGEVVPRAGRTLAYLLAGDDAAGKGKTQLNALAVY